jgi:hypothetical protein
MVNPISPNQADYWGQWSNSVFSSDPEQEKKLATYFIWLKDNFAKLTPSQKNDYNMLKVRQNFSILKNKPYNELSQQEKNFMSKYGVTANSTSPNSMDKYMEQIGQSSANINFVSSKSELPVVSTSRTGSTSSLTKLGKGSGFKKSQDVYKYQDFVSGETSYYYVVKDINRYDKTGGSTSNILNRYQNISEIVAKDPKPPVIDPPSGGSSTIKAGKTGPEKYIKVWHSEDYKVTYENEVLRQALDILNLPDLVLSQYDWQTIDSLADSNGSSVYENGEVIYEQYQEPEVKVQSTIPPEVANLVYKVQENISPIHDSLNNFISDDVTILSNFGFHKTTRADFTALYPSYRNNGEPRYDLEVEFLDVDGVAGYTFYLVEEDGII